MLKIEVITNVLDLLSFILAAPAFYDTVTKKNVNASYISALRLYARGHEKAVPRPFNYIAGAFLLIVTVTIDASMILLLKQSHRVFNDRMSLWMLDIVVWTQSVLNSGSPFFDAIVIVEISAFMCIVISNAFWFDYGRITQLTLRGSQTYHKTVSGAMTTARHPRTCVLRPCIVQRTPTSLSLAASQRLTTRLAAVYTDAICQPGGVHAPAPPPRPSGASVSHLTPHPRTPRPAPPDGPGG